MFGFGRNPKAIWGAPCHSGSFSEEVLEDGQSAGPMELIGPSHYVAVPGGGLEEMAPSAGTENLDVL